MSKEGITYFAELNDEGLLAYPKENVLQITAGDRIVFHIRPGSSISEKACLRINLPEITSKNIYRKTSTYMNSLRRRPSGPNLTTTKEEEPGLVRVKPVEREFGWIEFEVHFEHPGSFFYQIEYFDHSLNMMSKFKRWSNLHIDFTQPDWIVVHPRFITRHGEVTAESLVIQSMVSRCLGKVSHWPHVLGSQAKLGYNAVHLVPIQKYGSSGSMYSLKDQLSVDDWYVDDPNMPSEKRLELVKAAVDEVREKYGMLCFVDIVLNHTADNSAWLIEHPDAAYNLRNSPHLKVAWKFDKFLAEFSEAFSQRKVPECPCAPYIANDNDLRCVMSALYGRIKGLPLDQFFYYDKGKIKTKFDEFMKNVESLNLDELKDQHVDMFDFVLKHSFGYGEKPFGVDIEVDKVVSIILAKSSKNRNQQDVWNELNGYMDKCNGHWRGRYEGFMQEALKNIEDTLRYEKLTMRNTRISHGNPIVWRYFSELKGGSPEKDPDEYIVAHNGWTMVTEDFAAPGAFHYLRRIVHIWGDCIKLYYGKKREDSPYLWSHMEKYVGAMATIFQGLRVDNCHSTPLHVLEYFVNYGRSLNPSLFVFAELFSGSAYTDSLYTKRIGLNGLIREAIHCREAGHVAEMIRATGGDKDHPIGEVTKEKYLPDGRKFHVLWSTKPRSLSYDVTHDNPSSADAWNPQAILPVVCAMSMANEPIGTTHGVDEFYPKNLSVVAERRQYAVLQDVDAPNIEEEKEYKGKDVDIVYIGDANKVCVVGDFNGWKIDANILQKTGDRTWKTTLTFLPGKYQYKFLVNGNWALGPGPIERSSMGCENNVVYIEDNKANCQLRTYDDIRAVRKVCNDLHAILGKHRTTLSTYNLDDVLVVKRMLEDVDPEHESAYVMIARTTFHNGWGIEPENISKTITLPGKLSRVLFACNMYLDPEKVWKFAQDGKYATGPKGQVYFHMAGSGLKYFARVRSDGEYDCLDFFKMPSSFCMLVTTRFSPRQTSTLKALEKIEDPPVNNLSMGAINHLLFKCNPEEQDSAKQFRCIYEFKGIYPKYAGIAGLMAEFNKPQLVADFCNPIFENIKQGNWLIDYHLGRIAEVPELKSIHDWLMKYLAPVKEFKPVYRSKLFVFVISKLFHSIWKHVLNTAPLEFKDDLFCSSLILSAYQFMGSIPSSAYRDNKETMAAGLPYFSTNYMRCWGRDTMISMRGLLLIPQKYKEARDILLMFASVMRHGLIPNLHDKGNNTRFNSRDSTWFFMEALQQYVKHNNERGKEILEEKVDMQFLDSNQEEHFKKVSEGKKNTMCLADIVQHMMQSHASGIEFVEWNAGPKIDAHMRQEGFNVKIKLDPSTGFIYGGNKFNCGTWMDKMGSSEKAKNKGIPANPRDGADVEIIGLLRSALRFLSDAHEKGLYPYSGVQLPDNTTLTYKQWAALIDANFEKHFWIPSEMADWGQYMIDPNLVQQKGIYKDLVGCSDPSSEYRFRPNFAIAMAVAPEMFNREHALYALNMIETGLFEKGSLGLKTLHPSDKLYRPKYINNDDGTDFSMAHGFSYHMGPEWVWPMGYFLRALMIFGNFESKAELKKKVMEFLEGHRKHILTSPWMSLPEMTDAHGQECPFSCQAQAWSVASIIEAMYDLTKVDVTTKGKIKSFCGCSK